MKFANKVQFIPKEKDQKKYCISEGCRRVSTLEARYEWPHPKLGIIVSRIRCCDRLGCKEYAARLAIANVEEEPSKEWRE